MNILTKLSRNLRILFENITDTLTMDFGRRSTQKYTFRTSKLEDLRKLASLVTSTENFQDRYGKLSSILGTEMEDGLLNTLVQF